ncbi:MAG: prohibitin family protein [candidate division Zixibacteria bacterium]|nr:prohibitin family protein [candidate division Zixibacteria bacterium]
MVPLLVIGIIIFIIGFYIVRTNRDPRSDPRTRLAGRVGSIVGIILVVASIVFGSFTTVPAGHRGVVIRFSAVTGTVLGEGLRTKVPFIDSVVMMDVRTDKYEVGAAAASRDLQDVRTTIALNWRLDPARTAEIYRTLGMEYIGRITAPAVQEVVKQVTARHRAEDLIVNREMVRNEIAEELTNRLMERGIITEAVSITEFQFNETFVAAVEAKVAAEQAVLQAEFTLEQVKIEAQQRDERERGEANARMTKAEGEAEYIRIVTDAQVAANEAITDSLTPAVLQYILLDRLGEDIKLMVVPSGQGLDLVLPELPTETLE